MHSSWKLCGQLSFLTRSPVRIISWQMAHTSALSSSSGGTPSPSAGTGGAGISSGTGSAGNAAGSAGNAAGGCRQWRWGCRLCRQCCWGCRLCRQCCWRCRGRSFWDCSWCCWFCSRWCNWRTSNWSRRCNWSNWHSNRRGRSLTNRSRWRSTCRCWNRHLLLLLTPNELLDVPRRSCRWRGSRAEEFVLPTLTHSNSFHIQITEHQWKFLQDRFREACIRPLNTVERRLEAIAQLLIARHTWHVTQIIPCWISHCNWINSIESIEMTVI